MEVYAGVGPRQDNVHVVLYTLEKPIMRGCAMFMVLQI